MFRSFRSVAPITLQLAAMLRGDGRGLWLNGLNGEYYKNRASSIFQRFIIPNGFYSERFFFIPKGLYSKKIFYPKWSLFRRFLSQRVIFRKLLSVKSSLFFYWNFAAYIARFQITVLVRFGSLWFWLVTVLLTVWPRSLLLWPFHKKLRIWWKKSFRFL